MCIIRLGILRAVRFYRTATIVELRTILRDTERRRIVLDADGPLTCVEWTLILRSLGWTPCVSLYFLTVTSFFPFEFLVICATLGFMEADKFFFSIQTELYRNRVNYVSLRRNRSKFQVWNRGGKSCSNSEIYGYFLLRNNMGVYNVTRSIRNFWTRELNLVQVEASGTTSSGIFSGRATTSPWEIHLEAS